MFIGQYEHHLEEKGRISVPKKFRSQLESGAVLSQGLDGCLFLYPKTTWESLISKVASLPLTREDARGFTRSLSFGAVEVEFDRLGRILVPEYLRQFAQIQSDCVVAGVIDRVEIWSRENYQTVTAKINKHREEIAEKISSLGI